MFKALANVLTTHLGFSPVMADSSGLEDFIASTGLMSCPDDTGAVPPENIEELTLEVLTEPWMCRAGSVEKYIKDLSHNFTLSLLSS